MLKDKNILEEFNLVEEIEDKTAEEINGGITVYNELANRKAIGVYDPLTQKTQVHVIAGKGTARFHISGNSFLFYDRDNTVGYQMTWVFGGHQPISNDTVLTMNLGDDGLVYVGGVLAG